MFYLFIFLFLLCFLLFCGFLPLFKKNSFVCFVFFALFFIWHSALVWFLFCVLVTFNVIHCITEGKEGWAF